MPRFTPFLRPDARGTSPYPSLQSPFLWNTLQTRTQTDAHARTHETNAGKIMFTNKLIYIYKKTRRHSETHKVCRQDDNDDANENGDKKEKEEEKMIRKYRRRWEDEGEDEKKARRKKSKYLNASHEHIEQEEIKKKRLTREETDEARLSTWTLSSPFPSPLPSLPPPLPFPPPPRVLLLCNRHWDSRNARTRL